MKPLAVIVVSIAAALAVQVGASLLSSERVDAAQDPEGVALADLAQRVEGLLEQQREMNAKLDELEMRPAAAGGDRRVADEAGAIAQAVESYLANRTEALEAAALDVGDDEDGVFAGLDVRSILETLDDPNRDWLEKEELWQKLREEGRLDEVLAEYERLAELDPNNADRKVDLGYAYIQKIQEVGASALAGKWASMADAEFDAALELDPTHWKARFMKAMSLSHWPAFAGKQAETVSQFETLIEIQDSGPVKGEYLQTYLALGNIYMSQGKNDLAIQTWQKGLGVFPGNQELLAQIESLQGQ